MVDPRLTKWSIVIVTVFILIVHASGRPQIRMPIRNFPKPGWQDRPDPLASPDAIAGGEISIDMGPVPKSFNYYLDLSFQAAQIFGSLYGTLLSMNPLTLEYEPALAQNWSHFR